MYYVLCQNDEALPLEEASENGIGFPDYLASKMAKQFSIDIVPSSW
jgi:hypothetical protein